MGPSAARVSSMAACSAGIWRTSATLANTLAPSASSSLAAPSSRACVRPQIATLAPTAAKFFATPRLMPLPPPVTNTVLPLNRSLAKYLAISMGRSSDRCQTLRV